MSRLVNPSLLQHLLQEQLQEDLPFDGLEKTVSGPFGGCWLSATLVGVRDAGSSTDPYHGQVSCSVHILFGLLLAAFCLLEMRLWSVLLSSGFSRSAQLRGLSCSRIHQGF